MLSPNAALLPGLMRFAPVKKRSINFFVGCNAGSRKRQAPIHKVPRFRASDRVPAGSPSDVSHRPSLINHHPRPPLLSQTPHASSSRASSRLLLNNTSNLKPVSRDR
ncbi:hypothetical protein N431DRAFT_435231 [Stipitochalara longipes BDJ]|nr:hypothetical protein N431DRAFT_435231 [Stipitochalara longipes BDJ]